LAQPHLELEVAQQLLSRLDCPRALTVSILLRYGQYDDIVTLRAIPGDYLTADSFFRAYQSTRLLQKSEWLPTSFDKEAVALEAFWAAEKSCRSTNELLRSINAGTADFAYPHVSQAIKLAKRKIRSMLKGFSPVGFLDFCGFGPGADMSTVGGFTSAYNKLSEPGTVTREASLFLDFLASNSALCTAGFQWDLRTRSVDTVRVPGNKVTFVPKDCKTKRTIAVEPRWNVFFQKGMGVWLRRILLANGLDLNDQSLNQACALQGSRFGDIATLDLQSASDSVSYELIRLLLPEEWVDVLARLRSPSFFLDGKWHRAEKWSSMGNGYTFELESLVFYALCWGVVGTHCSVYGDDLAVPTSSVPEIVDVLTACGFILNSKKSYSSGPFRESCGSDYFNGFLVTPIYWKDKLHAEGTLRLVNQVSVLARRFGDGRSRDRRFRRVWSDLVYRLPPHFRRRGPASIATCVHSPIGEWARRARWGWDGWEVDVFVPISQKFRYKDYTTAVLSQWFQPSSDGYTIRDRTRLAVKTVFIPSSGLNSKDFVDVGEWE
jgi:hypothetical protein